MTEPNKTLTVSYGAFSCTLEGFEDPFSTMCAIAEFFRDLGADAPSFGSAPLAPHADTLAEIAADASNHEVETRLSEAALIFRRIGAPDDADDAGHADHAEAERPAGDDGPATDGPADARAADPSNADAASRIVAEGSAGDRDAAHAPGGVIEASDAAEADETPEDAAARGGDDPVAPGGRDPETPSASVPGDAPDHPQDGEDDALARGIQSVLRLGSQVEDDADDPAAEIAEIGRAAREAEADRPERRARTLDEWIAEEDGEVPAAPEEAPGDHDPEAARDAPPETEAAFDRLLVETDAQLGDEDGHRRRSTIAHLKAAVAATKADGLLRGNRGRPDADLPERRREDFDRTIRPRRPVAGSDPAQRRRPDNPVERGGTPLVLLSSLRVDGSDAPADAVRPRRIDRGEIAPDGSGPAGFARFVERIGATDLADVIQAAAAYTAIVEDRPEMSRPQLLRHAASRSLSGTSREDGLRSFDHLIETGHLSSLGRGRYGITAKTRFVDAARDATD